MKVLSLTQPYAALICSGTKRVETRSWKTNYRGPLYIHASKTKIKKEILANQELMQLVPDDISYGAILCKCDLVDCFVMTKDYVEDMKQNHYEEYLCGEYKEGRYAWVLENVEVLQEKISASGHLGIWNYPQVKE